MMNEEKTEFWYDRSIEEIELRFGTERGKGLKTSAVPKIRREHGANKIYQTPKGFSLKQFVSTDFVSLLLIAAVLVAMIFNVPVAGGVILGMLIVNYAAALFTYSKAQKVLCGMSEYSLPTAKVLRDGKPTLLDMRSLVPGDVIFLAAGDIVPADCRLFMSDGLFINEGTLTGFHSSVKKDGDYVNYSHELPIESRANMAYASTIVTAGSGRAIVVATGKNTACVRMDKVPSLGTHENLKILTTLKKYCSVWSLSMLGLVFVITLVNMVFMRDVGVFDVFLTGIALAAAAMSEFYVAFGYIMVGCGIFGAMKRRKDVNEGALIKNAEKLEALKGITALIIPKDGIITASHCMVDKVYTSGTLYSASDVDRVEKFRAAILAGVISTGIYGAGLTSLNHSSRHITAEEEAIIEAAEKLSLYNAAIDRTYPIIEHISAGGASKFDTTLTLDTDRRYMAVCRGDAAGILNSCDYYIENGRIMQMSTESRLELLNAASSLTKSSYRVAALATGMTEYNNLTRIGSIQSGLTFEGFLAIREPLQPNVAQTISRCKAAGVRVIMTTDRYAENDKYLAMSVGLIENENGILTPEKADFMSSDMLRTNLPLYNMYAGLNPAKISEIVKMLRADGEKVGLLAGGISGALLIKRADVGFAQSLTISPKAKKTGVDLRSRRSGAYANIARDTGFESEALKFISDVVISGADDKGSGGFSAVVSSLEYARTIYKNILRMVRYLTTTQLARVFIILGSLILGVRTLTPAQLIFGGLAVDLAAILSAAFAKPPYNALTLRDNAEETLEKPLMMNVRALLFALTQTAFVLVSHPLMTAMGFPLGDAEFTSMAFIAFTLCQLITFASTASEKSIFTPGMRVSTSYLAFSIGIAGFIAASLLIPSFGAAFGLCRIGIPALIACAVISLLTLAVNEIHKLLVKSDKTASK